MQVKEYGAAPGLRGHEQGTSRSVPGDNLHARGAALTRDAALQAQQRVLTYPCAF
jgi:hypothetical protein